MFEYVNAYGLYSYFIHPLRITFTSCIASHFIHFVEIFGFVFVLALFSSPFAGAFIFYDFGHIGRVLKISRFSTDMNSPAFDQVTSASIFMKSYRQMTQCEFLSNPVYCIAPRSFLCVFSLFLSLLLILSFCLRAFHKYMCVLNGITGTARHTIESDAWLS